ncbi:MAG: hypothetical protein AAGE52_07575 [Myxococcota bacterium]
MFRDKPAIALALLPVCLWACKGSDGADGLDSSIQDARPGIEDAGNDDASINDAGINDAGNNDAGDADARTDAGVEDTRVLRLNDLRAFPAAIGAGAFARIDPSTATIYEVTNLNPSGEGSFRQAFEARGPRIIIVKVEGLVNDDSVYVQRGPEGGDFAVWGQMAPGLGITIDHPRMSIDRAGNYYYRFVTLQERNAIGCTVNVDCFDALNYFRVSPNSSVMLDHMSLRYSPDQIWTLNVDKDLEGIEQIRSTATYVLFAEADPDHSTGSIMNMWTLDDLGTDIGEHTFARNMFYDTSHRFQNLNTNGDFENYNNYVVNHRARASRYNATPNVDFHRNYYAGGNVSDRMSGPEFRANQLNHGRLWGPNEPSIYSAFNFFRNVNEDVSDGMQDDLYVWFDTESEVYYGLPVVDNGPVPVEFFVSDQQFSFNPPMDGYWDTLDVPSKIHASVGHNRGVNADGTPSYGYDDVDADYIARSATDTTRSSYRETSEWNNSSFPGTPRYEDSDGDHMPDWFEDQFAFLDKSDPADMLVTTNVAWDFSAAGEAHDYIVMNDAGYTNLEICAAFYAGDFETMIDGTNNLSIED